MRGKGLCYDCGKKCDTRTCDRCREKRNQYRRRRYAADKAHRQATKEAAQKSYAAGNIRGSGPWVEKQLRERR